ncbi:MAG: hypothetical protein ABIA04_00125 [Pseudomonadota bacterium]
MKRNLRNYLSMVLTLTIALFFVGCTSSNNSSYENSAFSEMLVSSGVDASELGTLGIVVKNISAPLDSVSISISYTNDMDNPIYNAVDLVESTGTYASEVELLLENNYTITLNGNIASHAVEIIKTINFTASGQLVEFNYFTALQESGVCNDIILTFDPQIIEDPSSSTLKTIEFAITDHTTGSLFDLSTSNVDLDITKNGNPLAVNEVSVTNPIQYSFDIASSGDGYFDFDLSISNDCFAIDFDVSELIASPIGITANEVLFSNNIDSLSSDVNGKGFVSVFYDVSLSFDSTEDFSSYDIEHYATIILKVEDATEADGFAEIETFDHILIEDSGLITFNERLQTDGLVYYIDFELESTVVDNTIYPASSSMTAIGNYIESTDTINVNVASVYYEDPATEDTPMIIELSQLIFRAFKYNNEGDADLDNVVKCLDGHIACDSSNLFEIGIEPVSLQYSGEYGVLDFTITNDEDDFNWFDNLLVVIDGPITWAKESFIIEVDQAYASGTASFSYMAPNCTSYENSASSAAITSAQ